MAPVTHDKAMSPTRHSRSQVPGSRAFAHRDESGLFEMAYVGTGAFAGPGVARGRAGGASVLPPLNWCTGGRLYAPSAHERDTRTDHGWRHEGVAWYGVKQKFLK